MLPVNLVLVAFLQAAPAQQTAPVQPEAPRPTTAAADYQIGPDDILRITVFGHEDLTQTLVVQSDGTFIFPLVGRVKASAMTPKELERKLGVLLARGFIRNPQVTVIVQEYRSQTVLVMGEVARPGTYPLSGNMRVVEVLAKAGPTSTAGSEVVVVRPLGNAARPILPTEVAGVGAAATSAGPAPPGGGAPNAEAVAPAKQADILRVDMRAIQAGDLEKNILLRPNDTVFVPPASKFFVSGEVRNPGAYSLTGGLTVREAITIAGGFTEGASSGRIRVVREVEGKRREVKVKLDDPVLGGDTILVKSKLF